MLSIISAKNRTFAHIQPITFPFLIPSSACFLYSVPLLPPHLRYDRDAGQRSADRNRIEDARTYEYSDDADLCASHRHEDQQRHGGPRRQTERQGDDSPDNGCGRFINGFLWNCKSYRTRFTRYAACG
mgnify:CR=1 FL=1